ncbi:protein translocase subunit SecF [Candidatus Kaiserbacteria bacterium]|nr:protein translocase subunit SecF [Candidatus Kaiserbacteria bacterium]
MPVITHRKLFLIIAAVVIVGSFAIIGAFGIKFGIDFTGGSLTEVAYQAAPDKATVEAAVAALQLGEGSVRQSIDDVGRTAYLIRTRDLNDNERVALTDSVAALGDGGEITRFTSIGPVIGQELKDKAVWAIGAVVAIIVIYVAYAFAGIGTPVRSWTYGLITIFVLFHDILVPTALMSLLGQFAGVEADVLFIMALLAVLGYSVNDTIVVFDRVRENLVQNRTEHRRKVQRPGELETEEVTYTLTRPYAELVGEAVTQTLARSINTSLTTAIALAALYFFGGSVTQTFALILLVGVLAGTYSSILIASPLVVAYAKWRGVNVDGFDATDKAR